MYRFTIESAKGGDRTVSVSDVCYDSRNVSDGALFIAMKGYTVDGHAYIDDAIRKGAKAVVYDASHDITAHMEAHPDVTFIAVDEPRRVLSEIAAYMYDAPSNRMHVAGVTGTNGKTTTAYLLRAIFKKAGYTPGLIGTIENMIGDTVTPSTHTTPESLELHALFGEMVRRDVTHLAMEVSSHALFLHRADNIFFDAIVFTNITEDHLDFHKTMDEYLKAKLIAFDILARSPKKEKYVFLNTETDRFLEIKAYAEECGLAVVTYGFSPKADYYAKVSRLSIDGTAYKAYHNASPLCDVSLSLIGEFNVLNSLSALAYAHTMGIPLERLRAALASVRVPGRFEVVKESEGAPFTVVVDYAHTDDALTNVLTAARALEPNRVITVFGCGGDRDRAKRPLMGKAAGAHSDYVVLTLDNPRTEDIDQIIKDIRPGLDETRVRYDTIIERRNAIARAIEEAREGDLVLIAGKGHEDYQIFRDRTIHFDDREVAGEVLKSNR